MPKVWIRDDPKRRTRFHRVPDCKQLRKPPSRGDHHPLIEVDLSEVGVRPCKTCYPDVPRVYIRKTYCPFCDTKCACPHNGGVLVTCQIDGRRRYVWPDTNQMPFYRTNA